MLALLLLACLGSVSANSRIIGGSNTDTSVHPHQISLTTSTNSHICGGSIIDEFWVLTAAHCVGNAASTYRIHVNDGSRNDGERVIFNVVQKIVHPNYNKGTGAYPNDVALLKTSTSLTATSSGKIIGIAGLSDGDFANSKCTISGWGRTVTGGSGSLPNQLQETSGSILSNEACRAQWSTNYNSAAHICITGDSNSGSCNGDSGGPMVCNNKLAGVTSWGVSGCFTTYPSVYARVSSYNSWIIETIEANS